LLKLFNNGNIKETAVIKRERYQYEIRISWKKVRKIYYEFLAIVVGKGIILSATRAW